MERNLSEKERKVYELIVKKAQLNLPPTVREICRELNIKSTSTVHKILSNLDELGLIEKGSNSSRAIRIKNRENSISVPLVGKVTAGKPILAVEDIEDYIPFPDTFGAGEFFALNVMGLSMKNAGILDGDVVIAKRQNTADKGDIVIALIEDEATVKRLGYENGKAVLYPENEEFQPIYSEDLHILGKVVGSFRKY